MNEKDFHVGINPIPNQKGFFECCAEASSCTRNFNCLDSMNTCNEPCILYKHLCYEQKKISYASFSSNLPLAVNISPIPNFSKIQLKFDLWTSKNRCSFEDLLRIETKLKFKRKGSKKRNKDTRYGCYKWKRSWN